MPRRRTVPKAKELREWRPSEISYIARLLDSELERRERVAANAEEKERERLQRLEAARLARTVIRSRHIRQKVKCGKPTCHCMNGGPLHGGYWYRIDTCGDGRRSKKYVGKKKPKKMPPAVPASAS